MNLEKLQDSFNLDNLSRYSRYRRYCMTNDMNMSELDPCMAAKIRLKHPADCSCWSFWKFFVALILALIIVILFIMLLFHNINARDQSNEQTSASTTTSTTESTTTRRPSPRFYKPTATSPRTRIIEQHHFYIGPAETTKTTATTSTITSSNRPQEPKVIFEKITTKNLMPQRKVPGKLDNEEDVEKEIDWNKIDQKVFESCDQHVNRHHPNGIHNLTISPLPTFPARCFFDNSTGEAWMLVQERTGTSLDFATETKLRYEKGFGNVNGDHWLGLEKLLAFVKHNKKLVLRYEAKGHKCSGSKKDENNEDFYVHGEYNFDISGPESNYTLRNIKFIPGSGNSQEFSNLEDFNNLPFVSPSEKHYCAMFKVGGWWMKSDCPWLALNGAFNYQCKYGGAVVAKTSGPKLNTFFHPTYTRMMLRFS